MIAKIHQQNSAWVKLEVDSLKLVIEQQHIKGVELTNTLIKTDINTEQYDADPLIAGWLKQNEEEIPVFCFSKQLDLLDQPPNHYEHVAIIEQSGEKFGLACKSLQPFSLSDQPKISGLPECMVAHHNPIIGFMQLDQEIYYLIGPKQLDNYISHHIDNAVKDSL